MNRCTLLNDIEPNQSLMPEIAETTSVSPIVTETLPKPEDMRPQAKCSSRVDRILCENGAPPDFCQRLRVRVFKGWSSYIGRP